MAAPTGFAWTRHKNGDVVITHHGRVAATLRNRKAAEFLDDDAGTQDQELMAHLTGNYRRGNERQARTSKNHRDHRPT